MKALKKTSKKKNKHDLPPRLESELAISSVVPPQNGNYTRVFHAVNPGDLVASMGAIKKYHDVTKRKCIISQSLTTVAVYYQGAKHPTVNERGENTTFNMPMWEMMKPLVESQEYVHSFEIYGGQKIDLDFNIIRGKTYVNMPHGPIQGWVPLAFPDLQFDISKPWIHLSGECPDHIKKQVEGKIILNFTERYRNSMADYHYLRNYAPDLIFAGTAEEHWVYCNQWGLTIPRLEIKDFLEYAYAIKESRFILCNQSLGWNLAQALGHPRVLEMCSFADNCFPNIGENSLGWFYQVGNEHDFRKMYNLTIKK